MNELAGMEEIKAMMSYAVKQAFNTGVACGFNSVIDYLDGQLDTFDHLQVEVWDALKGVRDWVETVKLDVALDEVKEDGDGQAY